MAYELIETIELAASASSIEFTSIPQDGVDLLLVFSAREVSSSGPVWRTVIEVNSSQSADYVRFYGTGSGVVSAGYTVSSNFGFIPAGLATSNTFGNARIYFSNYTSSADKNFNSNMATENNAQDANLTLLGGHFNVTSAITSLGIVSGSGLGFAQYSTASLYKIY